MSSDTRADVNPEGGVSNSVQIDAEEKSAKTNLLFTLEAYLKQATLGPFSECDPNQYSFISPTILKAWSNLGNMPRTEARKLYINGLASMYDEKTEGEPNKDEFNVSASVRASNIEKNTEKDSHSLRTSSCKNTSALKQSWACVSMPYDDEYVPDYLKDVFDWIKDGDLEKVRGYDRTELKTLRDVDGMFALHWAADRGHVDIAQYLIAEVEVDVNCVDCELQTPLHYAACSGHFDMCKLLVDSRANICLKDKEGSSPLDVAEEAEVRQLLLEPA